MRCACAACDGDSAKDVRVARANRRANVLHSKPRAPPVLARHGAAALPRRCEARATASQAAAAGGGGISAAAAALGIAHDTGATPCNATRVAVLFTGDRCDAACGDAVVRRLCSPGGAARAVASRLQNARVLAVVPARYVAGAFAAYDGWLPAWAMDARGEAREYRGDARAPAWRRLAAALCACDVPRTQPLLLLGASKGASPVNQLLAELAAADAAAHSHASGVDARRGCDEDADDAAARMASLRDVHLLDAGALRRGAAHLTDAATLDALAAALRRRNARLHLHGTPRQWADARRPWLATEAEEVARCARGQLVAPAGWLLLLELLRTRFSACRDGVGCRTRVVAVHPLMRVRPLRVTQAFGHERGAAPRQLGRAAVAAAAPARAGALCRG